MSEEQKSGENKLGSDDENDSQFDVYQSFIDLENRVAEIEVNHASISSAIDELLEKHEDDNTVILDKIKEGIESSRNRFFDRLLNFITWTTTFSFAALLWMATKENNSLSKIILIGSFICIGLSIVISFVLMSSIIHLEYSNWGDCREVLKNWKRVNGKTKISSETLFTFLSSFEKTFDYNSFYQKPEFYLIIYLVNMAILMIGLLLFIQGSLS